MPTIVDDHIDFDRYLSGPEDDAHVRSPVQYGVDVKALFRSDSVGDGLILPWPKTQDYFRLRPGEVTIWAGINGHGKTLLHSQVQLAIMQQGGKVCSASMEMKPARTLHRMVQQAACTTSPSDEYIDAFVEWADNKLYLYDQQGVVTPERMLALARYARYELGIGHMVIDSLMKCGIHTEDYNGQKEFIAQLSAHAMDTGMHVHLIAHSRKGDDERDRIGKFSVKGASEITDQVDNLFLVWRNKGKEEKLRMWKIDAEEARTIPDCILTNEKQRHGRPGDERGYSLWLDVASSGFVESPGRHVIPLDLNMQKKAEAEGAVKMMEVPF